MTLLYYQKPGKWLNDSKPVKLYTERSEGDYTDYKDDWWCGIEGKT